MPARNHGQNVRGFTLIETLVSFGLLLIIMGAVLTLYYTSIQAIGIARARVTAIALANEQLELARNLAYADVGTTTGWPAGVLESVQTIDRNGLRFTISTFPKYVDDPFDGNALGTIPNKPVDTQPSDYKLVEVRVCWSHYPCGRPISVSSSIVPDGVEGDDGTGSLFIQSLDASGLPVGQAAVTVTNSTTFPPINISSSTDNDGNLLLSSMPPAQDSYHIVVSKSGYNDDYTIAPSPPNPNPTRPDTSVVAGQVTSLAFFVDTTADLSLLTVGDSCAPIPDVQFTLRGDLLDGSDPDVYRYDTSLTTNAFGRLDLAGLHWDVYTQTIDPAEGYDVAGTTISQPFNVLPGSNQTVYIHLAPNADHTLLVTVRESGTLTPLSDATVRLEDFAGFDETKTTGKGTVEQRDWSGGPGQVDFTDPTKFFSQDGNLDASQPNLLRLGQSTSSSSAGETFDTDLNADYGATTADWNVGLGMARLKNTLGLYDTSGAVQTLTLNTSPVVITTATLTVVENLNGQMIQYQLSADSGATFENVTPGLEHAFAVEGTDLRFRAVLTTTDQTVTPELLGFSIDIGGWTFLPNGNLISSTMNLGPDSAFDALQWLPFAQPPEAGPSSVQIQIATNTDQSTWVFVGPDGTTGTSYTTSGDTLWSGHAGDQYLRYKITLTSADPTVSPSLTTLSIIHSSGCVPPGQAFFTPLTAGTYQLTVNRAGYNEYIDSVDVSGDTTFTVDLTPP